MLMGDDMETLLNLLRSAAPVGAALAAINRCASTMADRAQGRSNIQSSTTPPFGVCSIATKCAAALCPI